MAEMHRARVCAVGSEADMTRLLRVMMENAGELEETEELLAPRLSREEMEATLHRLAKDEGGMEDGFLYGTLSRVPFGSAEIKTTRMTIREEACGLWTACFAYDSFDPFQVEDWMQLHLRCGRVLMVAQYASYRFGLEKGATLLSGGRALDNWDMMAEIWLWLIAQYECGYPPEEAAQRLKRLQSTMDMEDCGQTVPELLQSCLANLHTIASRTADPAALRAAYSEAVSLSDFPLIESIQIAVGESVLWETEHLSKWQANIQAVLEAVSGDTVP